MYFHNSRYAETHSVCYSAKMKLAHFLFAKKAIKTYNIANCGSAAFVQTHDIAFHVRVFVRFFLTPQRFGGIMHT